MPELSFVYPSMVQPEGTFRGGLLSRWAEASQLDCNYIEIPANFVKNAHEERVTGIEVCQMLTDSAIGHLYFFGPRSRRPPLYSPHWLIFAHPDSNGIKRPAADLRWHDQEWSQNSVQCLFQFPNALENLRISSRFILAQTDRSE